MQKFARLLVVLGAGLLLPHAAQAALIPFNFNDLSDNSSNSQVQDYMNLVLSSAHPGGTVAVTGAQGEKNYNGDDHVVGPVSGSKVTSQTLGNTDGGTSHGGSLDTFLINNGTDRITLVFSFPIYSISFDYEIFPNGDCAQADAACTPTSANWPDFTFRVDDTQQFNTKGVLPGTGGTFPHSPSSGASNTEPAPQFLGVSGLLNFPTGVVKFEFVDWPPTIGIDNLIIGDVPPDRTPIIPEPGTIALLGGGLIALWNRRRRSLGA